MSRSVSSIFRSAVFSQETDEVFLLLLTIDHDDLAEPIRVSSDAVDTVSRGNTFVAYAFDLTLADDTDDGPQQMRISIDNVDRMIVEAVREISSPPDVTVEVVLHSDPDTVEVSFDGFTLTDVSYDVFTVSGTISTQSYLNEPYPGGSVLPSNFPGAF